MAEHVPDTPPWVNGIVEGTLPWVQDCEGVSDPRGNFPAGLMEAA